MKKLNLYIFLSLIFNMLFVSTAICGYANNCDGKKCHIQIDEPKHIVENGKICTECFHINHLHNHHNFIISSMPFEWDIDVAYKTEFFYKNSIVYSLKSEINRPPIC